MRQETEFAQRPPWLQSLHKAQAAVDSGVRIALRGESLLRQSAPACAHGCSACCASRQPAATAVEAAGALTLLAHLDEELAQRALGRLTASRSGGCPFLEGTSCAVYPMRPIACRQLLVFGRACAPGEDPRRGRPGDVLTPLSGHALRAYSLLLPHLGERPDLWPDPRAASRLLSCHVLPVGSLDAGLILGLMGSGFSRAAA